MRGFNALFFFYFFSASAIAAALPPCNDIRGNPLAVDNERVLRLKTTTPSGYKDRAFIQGVLVGVISEKGSHLKLDVYLGDDAGSTHGTETDIEIIYNKAFGEVRGRLSPGMEVSACGDFINAFKQNGRFPASPMGAILHWVHMAPRPDHQSGFLAIDGAVYGQVDPDDRGGGQRDFRRPRNDNNRDQDDDHASIGYSPMFGLGAFVN